MSKLTNVLYIVSIEISDCLVQIKMSNTIQALNYVFDNIEQVQQFVIGVIDSVGFINLDEMCKEVKTVKEVVKTPITPIKPRVRKTKK